MNRLDQQHKSDQAGNAIAVVIPTYNRPEGLIRAIKSLTRQNRLPDEVIIVDDCSENDIPENEIKEILKQTKVIIERLEKNSGACRARNRGVELSSSGWIAFLDDDDEFMKEKLEEIEKVLPDKADVYFHQSLICFVNEEVSYKSESGKSSENIYNRLLMSNVVGGNSVVVINKEKFEVIGGYDERLPALQDYELWLRMAKAGLKFQCVNEVLTKYNSHTKELSITSSSNLRSKAREIIDEEYHEEIHDLSEAEMKKRASNIHKGIIYENILCGRKWKVIKLSVMAFFKFHDIKFLLSGIMIIFGVRLYLKAFVWYRSKSEIV